MGSLIEDKAVVFMDSVRDIEAVTGTGYTYYATTSVDVRWTHKPFLHFSCNRLWSLTLRTAGIIFTTIRGRKCAPRLHNLKTLEKTAG